MPLSGLLRRGDGNSKVYSLFVLTGLESQERAHPATNDRAWYNFSDYAKTFKAGSWRRVFEVRNIQGQNRIFYAHDNQISPAPSI